MGLFVKPNLHFLLDKGMETVGVHSGTFQDLPEVHVKGHFQEQTNGVGAGVALGIFIEMWLLGLEVYSVYTLGSAPGFCAIGLVLAAQAIALVVVPAVTVFAISPMRSSTWDLWCVRSILLVYWFLFCSSLVALRGDEGCQEMETPVRLFMVVDVGVCCWAVFGLLTGENY